MHLLLFVHHLVHDPLDLLLQVLSLAKGRMKRQSANWYRAKLHRLSLVAAGPRRLLELIGIDELLHEAVDVSTVRILISVVIFYLVVHPVLQLVHLELVNRILKLQIAFSNSWWLKSDSAARFTQCANIIEWRLGVVGARTD